MQYHKLVRDNIPEIIAKTGKLARMHIADKEEYEQKLKEKLLEEATELAEAMNIEEMADVLEVIHAICDLKGIDKNQIESVRLKKAEDRGAFKQQIILEETRD